MNSQGQRTLQPRDSVRGRFSDPGTQRPRQTPFPRPPHHPHPSPGLLPSWRIPSGAGGGRAHRQWGCTIAAALWICLHNTEQHTTHGSPAVGEECSERGGSPTGNALVQNQSYRSSSCNEQQPVDAEPCRRTQRQPLAVRCTPPCHVHSTRQRHISLPLLPALPSLLSKYWHKDSIARHTAYVFFPFSVF